MAKKRKQLIQNSMQYANLLTKLEGGKSQIKVGDMRQAIKLMRNLETALILKGNYRSALLTIRREAVSDANKIMAKKNKTKLTAKK